MEIQFTIKLLGASGSTAVFTSQGSNAVEASSLGTSFAEHATPAEPAGKGGAGQDPTGSGTGGVGGLGQVIVIGPIVISGGLPMSGGAGPGGAGQDPTGSGTGSPKKTER